MRFSKLLFALVAFAGAFFVSCGSENNPAKPNVPLDPVDPDGPLGTVPCVVDGVCTEMPAAECGVLIAQGSAQITESCEGFAPP
jgi:hypothetical protein